MLHREREKKRYRVKILLMYSRFLPLNYIFFYLKKYLKPLRELNYMV